MIDCTDLQKAAEYAAQDTIKFAAEDEEMRALQQFHEEVNPETVLALIAENDRLNAENKQLIALECHGGTAEAAINLLAERDQLKAENEALREEVALDDKLIADRDRLLNMFECPVHGQCIPYAMEQVETLRKALTECADSLHAEMLQKFGGQLPEDMHPVTRREYDRDMAEVARYRSAMGKGEQS